MMQRRKFITAAGLSLLALGKIAGREIPLPGIASKKRSHTIKTAVLVVGGGPAGIGAAIGAAKAGAQTLLIENYGFFGGVASWGVGMCMNQMRPDETSTTCHQPRARGCLELRQHRPQNLRALEPCVRHEACSGAQRATHRKPGVIASADESTRRIVPRGPRRNGSTGT